MSKTNWEKLINKKKDEVLVEVRNSLANATGCASNGQGQKDVLYITQDGELRWYRCSSFGEIPESVNNGYGKIVYEHDIDALGCYGCTEDCYEFDEKPKFLQQEIDEEIEKLVEHSFYKLI